MARRLFGFIQAVALGILLNAALSDPSPISAEPIDLPITNSVIEQHAQAFPAQAAPAQPPVGPPDGKANPKGPDQPGGKDDILNLDIERLGTVPARVNVASGFNAPVTTVGRELDVAAAPSQARGPTVGTSPAAVYVVTAEDIHRTGVRTIPDALRMVPGVDVARIDANKWAISVRGFNTQFANKLLVLIDGRSVYTPLFGGVLWDERDLLIEDVERIEVIRGPGATLWGANAVNGVINIITKKAQETQGGMVYGGGGSEPRSSGAVEYGGKLGDNAFYRVYFKYFTYGNGEDVLGNRTADAWDQLRGGFRLDWDPTPYDSIMFQGDLFSGNVGSTVPVPLLTSPYSQTVADHDAIAGGYFLNRWTHSFSETSGVELRWYVDHTDRRYTDDLREIRDIVDFDFEHRFQLTDRQQIVWGAGYRWTNDDIEASDFGFAEPSHRTLNLSSAYAQDDVTLVKDKLHWIIGSKFEQNDFTGFEIQPSTRLLWTPTERQTLWGAISRAVRTPTRADADLTTNPNVQPPGALFPGSPVTLTQFEGSQAFLSEEMIAYELGYRASPTERFSYDIALFLNDYQNLSSAEPGTPFFVLAPVPHLVLPIVPTNALEGQTYGAEFASSWRPNDRWRLSAAYTLLQMHLHPAAGSVNPGLAPETNGESPRNQFNLRSYFDVTPKLQLDAAMYYVDSLPSIGIPSYIRLDLRLGWHPRENIEMVLGMQNLQQAQHPEFGGPSIIVVPSQAPRSVYGLLKWKF